MPPRRASPPARPCPAWTGSDRPPGRTSPTCPCGSGHGFQRPGLLHTHDSSISHRRRCHLGGAWFHGYGLAPGHGSAGRADTRLWGGGPGMVFRRRVRTRACAAAIGRAGRTGAGPVGRRPEVGSATERGMGPAQVDVPTLRPAGGQGRFADRTDGRCPHRGPLGPDVCAPDGARLRGACADSAGHAHDLPWSYAAARASARRHSAARGPGTTPRRRHVRVRRSRRPLSCTC